MASSTETMSIKPGDVFRFSWHYDESKQHTDRMWCFDGKLVAHQAGDGILLVDTYWDGGQRVHSDAGKRFTPEEAFKAGSLEFICNLNDVEPVKDYECRWYDKEDLFDLSYQHRCYGRYMKRKGAKKSKEAMRRALAEDRREVEENLRAAVHKLEWIARSLQQIEDAPDVEKLYP